MKVELCNVKDTLQSLSVSNPHSVLSSQADGSVGFSLWDRKTTLEDLPCFWKLQPGAGPHGLTELSVCVLVRLRHRRPWTGFVYKAPGGTYIELGLKGTSSSLDVWLLGKKVRVEAKLKPNQRNSICITWSGAAQRLHVYINGTSQRKISAGPSVSRPLAQNGTLTLGMSHYVDAARQVMMEDSSELLVEIGRFRMWNRERSPEELRGRICAYGDALNWEAEQWRYGCSPEFGQRSDCGK